MQAKQVVRLFYLLSAIIGAGMGFTMAVYSNFLRGAGLDELQLNLVNLCFFAIITISEIPTGLFADIFGRKSSFVISCFLQAMAHIIYGSSKNFLGFVLAESICAIAHTFSSGAFEAWLKDSLKQTGSEINTQEIFIRRGLITKLSAIIPCIIGGKIGDYGLNFPFFAAGIVFVIAGIMTMIMMKETYFIKEKYSFTSGLTKIRKTWSKALSFVKKDLDFRFLMVITMVQTFAFMAPNMQWPKMFKDLGFDNSDNGLIGSLINIAIVIGIISAGILIRYQKDEKKQLVLAQILTGICIVLTVSFAGINPIIIFFLLHEVGRGMSEPLMSAFTQNCITDDEERATITSIKSMAQHFGGVVGLLVSGLIAKYADITPAWIVSGIFLILATLWLARNHRKR